MIVSRNSSVTLFCPAEANPKVTSYTWIKVPLGSSVEDERPAYEDLGRSLGNSASLKITPSMFQAFKNDKYSQSEESSSEPKSFDDQFVDYSLLNDDQFLQSKSEAKGRYRRSSPDDVVGVICYAKNSEGYSVKPCLYSMQVVGK